MRVNMSRGWWLVAGGFLMGAVTLMSARAARADEALVGRRAPDLHVYETQGGPAPDLRALRGQLVVLEVFRTQCPHCQQAVSHLNALQRARGGYGLSVVAITHERGDRVVPFRSRHDVQYPTARVDVEVLRDYGVTAVPSAWLISPEGRVLWAGVPTALTLERVDGWLRQTRPWPVIPAGLRSAAADLRADRFPEARTTLTAWARALDAGRDAAVAAELLAWMGRYADVLTEDCQRGGALQDPHERWWACDARARLLVGTPQAEQALSWARSLWEGESGHEVRAGAALQAARARWRHEGLARGRDALRAVAAAHPGTRAGRVAGEIATRLARRS